MVRTCELERSSSYLNCTVIFQVVAPTTWRSRYDLFCSFQQDDDLHSSAPASLPGVIYCICNASRPLRRLGVLIIIAYLKMTITWTLYSPCGLSFALKRKKLVFGEFISRTIVLFRYVHIWGRNGSDKRKRYCNTSLISTRTLWEVKSRLTSPLLSCLSSPCSRVTASNRRSI